MRFRHEDRSAEAVGYRLRILGAALGINQTQMAKRAGLATNTLNQWWKGSERMSLDKGYAWNIVDTFDVTLDYLYRGIADGLPARFRDELAEAETRLNQSDVA